MRKGLSWGVGELFEKATSCKLAAVLGKEGRGESEKRRKPEVRENKPVERELPRSGNITIEIILQRDCCAPGG